MRTSRKLRIVGGMAALSLFVAACGDDDDTATTGTTEPAETTTAGDDMDDMDGGMDDEGAMPPSSEICDADGLVDAVQSGPEAGTLEGMTDDPVGTAASNNPVLTTLVTAVSEAGLVDTLNSAEALTVFAPTDCAFAALDEETLNAALADPEGLLTEVLGFHVIAGEQLASGDLEDGAELETFGGQTLTVSVDGDTVSVGDGQANVVVPDIQTANATVHLIDSVMLPPM